MKDLEGEKINGNYNGIMVNNPSDVCLMSNGGCGSHIIFKTISNEIWALGRNEYKQVPFFNSVENERLIMKPHKIPSEYFHIIGYPMIDESKSRSAKSARK